MDSPPPPVANAILALAAPGAEVVLFRVEAQRAREDSFELAVQTTPRTPAWDAIKESSPLADLLRTEMAKETFAKGFASALRVAENYVSKLAAPPVAVLAPPAYILMSQLLFLHAPLEHVPGVVCAHDVLVAYIGLLHLYSRSQPGSVSVKIRSAVEDVILTCTAAFEAAAFACDDEVERMVASMASKSHGRGMAAFNAQCAAEVEPVGNLPGEDIVSRLDLVQRDSLRKAFTHGAHQYGNMLATLASRARVKYVLEQESLLAAEEEAGDATASGPAKRRRGDESSELSSASSRCGGSDGDDDSDDDMADGTAAVIPSARTAFRVIEGAKRSRSDESPHDVAVRFVDRAASAAHASMLAAAAALELLLDKYGRSGKGPAPGPAAVPPGSAVGVPLACLDPATAERLRIRSRDGLARMAHEHPMLVFGTGADTAWDDGLFLRWDGSGRLANTRGEGGVPARELLISVVWRHRVTSCPRLFSTYRASNNVLVDELTKRMDEVSVEEFERAQPFVDPNDARYMRAEGGVSQWYD